MLSDLKNKRLVWLANERTLDTQIIKTDYCEFDHHYKGLPQEGLIELQTMLGIGEIRFLANYLQQKQQQGMLVIAQSPGFLSSEFLLQQGFSLEQLLVITARSNTDVLWAIEQCLKSGLCSCLVLWCDDLSFTAVRRLNLLCEQEQASLIVVRSVREDALHGCKLSLQLQPELNGLRIRIKKRRGKPLNIDPFISLDRLWPNYSWLFSTETYRKSVNYRG